MTYRLSATAIALLYAAFAAAWIVVSGTVLEFAAFDPAVQNRIEIAKGIAFVVVTSCLLYLAIREYRQTPAASAPDLGEEPESHALGRFVPVVLVLMVLPVIAGFAVFTLYGMQVEKETFASLRAVAGFKGTQVENWLKECRLDGVALAGSRGFIERVDAMQQRGDERERDIVQERLAGLRAAHAHAHAYDAVTLLGARGQSLFASGDPPREAATPEEGASRILNEGPVRMRDLYRDDRGHIRLDFVVPLKLGGRAGAVGTVVIHVDPGLFLFPLLKSWPTASDSAETLLVRRDGGEVHFLNELRHQKGSALTLRVPLDRAQLPAATALLKGGTGTTRGVDYRGHPVLAAWHAVAGTDWQLLAKVDRSEALEPAVTAALWAAGIAFLGVSLLMAALALVVRQQRATRQFALEFQADRLLKHFYELPFIGMAVSSPQTRRWIRFNDQLCATFGYTREELAQKTWPEMTHPEDLAKNEAQLDRVMRGRSEGYKIEKRFFRKDGSVVATNLDVKCVRAPDGAVEFLLATIEDLTERRAAETKIVRLNGLYETLSRCNAAIARCKDEAGLFDEVCRAVVESGGMKMAWVGKLDPQTRLVRPVARFGANTGYLDGIRISLDCDDPNGQGPVGSAMREGEPFWCQDFRNDPRTAPWRERAAQYGWGVAACLPLVQGGKVVGVLTLYGSEPNSLDEEARGLLLRVAADVSFGLERFKQEAALAESESLFRSIVEQAIAGLYIVQDGKLAYANPRVAEIFGYESLAEVVGRDVLSFFTEDQREVVREKVRMRMQGEVKSLSYTTKGVRKDGSVIELGVHGALATFHGRPAVIGLIQDITEKKRDEDMAERHLAQLKAALMRTIEVATTLSEMRDPYTAGHERRVALIAVAIAAELGFDERRIEGLRVAGYLHDIGKMTIPSEILSKPGKLSAAEYELIKGHAQASYDVLKNVDFPWPVADMVLQHHERIDGTGYPQGLKGDAILPEAKILAVSDVVEAMASHRPYRPGLGVEKALAEIERGRGTAYDLQAANACLRIFREKGFSLPA